MVTLMSYKESQNLPKKQKCQETALNELRTLKQREIFELVPRPEKDRVLGSRWVFTLKKDEAGKEKCFKARFVAK